VDGFSNEVAVLVTHKAFLEDQISCLSR